MDPFLMIFDDGRDPREHHLQLIHLSAGVQSLVELAMQLTRTEAMLLETYVGMDLQLKTPQVLFSNESLITVARNETRECIDYNQIKEQ